MLPSCNNPLIKAKCFVHFFKSLRKEIKRNQKNLTIAFIYPFEDLILNLMKELR